MDKRMWCFCLIGILCVTTLAVCAIACRASDTEGGDAATSNTKSNTNSATTLPDCTEQQSSAANSQTAISAMMLEGRWELYNAIAGNTSIYNTAAKSNRFGTQDKPNKNVIRTWATTQEKSIQRISRPK